jgi:hypothetical protein
VGNPDKDISQDLIGIQPQVKRNSCFEFQRIIRSMSGYELGRSKMESFAWLGTRSAKGNRPCIWMQAEVVRQKSCKINYDCPSCRFDKAMRRLVDENTRLKKAGRVAKGNRPEFISWKEKLRALPLSKRPCIHHMKGRIEFRPCTNDYWCGNCDFDQYFHDQYSVHAVIMFSKSEDSRCHRGITFTADIPG